jgi:DNA invertase Pin-like site-specific DNA recombinase
MLVAQDAVGCKLLFTMRGSIAEFESEIRKDRDAGGLAFVRGVGVSFGRSAAMSDGKVADLRRWRNSGERSSELMSHYGLSKVTSIVT